MTGRLDRSDDVVNLSNVPSKSFSVLRVGRVPSITGLGRRACVVYDRVIRREYSSFPVVNKQELAKDDPILKYEAPLKVVRGPLISFTRNVLAASKHTFKCSCGHSKVCCVMAQAFSVKVEKYLCQYYCLLIYWSKKIWQWRRQACAKLFNSCLQGSLVNLRPQITKYIKLHRIRM